MAELKALTFDLWDTLVADDSDELERARRGLRSKRDERRALVLQALNSVEPTKAEDVELAFDVADAAFNRVWRHQHVTWTIDQRVDVILRGMGRSLPEEHRALLIEQLESMEVEIPPVLIDGCREALETLSSRYSLAVVSDAIVTPGRKLRQLLENHGVKKYFSAFAFSDEIGFSKPHRTMFEFVSRELGVGLGEMLHIGDREHNDVDGAHGLGMRAILFTATRDVDQQGSKADAICQSYADLPAMIDRLSERPL